jgi:hypothetical protein
MEIKLKIVDPLQYPDWDTRLLSIKESTFFHSHAWCNVLSSTYGYIPNYFLSFNKGKLSTVIPFMEINTYFSPKRGISLPFSDFCSPILSEDTGFHQILDSIVEYAKTSNWKFVEFRGGNGYLDNVIPSALFYEHNLNLKRNEKELLSSFRSSTKRNIKKATNKDVRIQHSNSLGAVREFYRLHCLTRKDHGLPPQPFSFFKNIHAYIVAKKKGFVLLALHQGKVIAGAIFFHFGKKAIYKYGASIKKYQHLRANNLLMWEAIKWYNQNGYCDFSFGRTEPENTGLLQFKRGWGTKERSVNYYKYNVRNSEFIEDPFRVGKLNKIGTKLPVFLLKIAGSLMYKHVG